MNDEPIIVPSPENESDNRVRPFQVEGMDVRGRAARLGTVMQQILAAHDYPEPIACLLGEMLVLTSLLGSMIKFEGLLTLQVKSDGPVSMLVTDYQSLGDTEPGAIRGYAQFDKDVVDGNDDAAPEHMLGEGYLAITIDQGADMERYQGIVELSGRTISQIALAYFQDSEQTPTAIRLKAARDDVTGHWRGGGIMVQHLAQGGERLRTAHNYDYDDLSESGEEDKDAWQRAAILMESVQDSELVDRSLEIEDLLYRLYHEDGVRVFDPRHLARGCRCTRARIKSVFGQFPAGDIEDMAEDGKISVNCEFCNKCFDFDPAEFLSEGSDQ